MKTPKFWNNKGLISTLLLPISSIYGAITQLRIKFSTPYKCSAKVICIGNITAGGVGKTPIAIAMAEKYIKEGKKVFFVTRGYKGKLKNILVDLTTHTPEETGDEARLLAQTAPTIISPQRDIGAKMAVSMGAEVIIMDDGFQNPSLYKDESWLVFDGNIGIGNGRIIPAGPLRETLKNGQKRAQHIIIMGKDTTNLAPKCNLPIHYGHIEPKPFELTNKRVLAFAGIGHPQKFYNTLQTNGYEVIKSIDFADHHQYTINDIAQIKEIAQKENLSIVTTEKDYIKLSDEMKENIQCFKIRAIISN